MICGTTALSQPSPVPIEQSCISEQRFGVIHTKFARRPAARSVVKLANGTTFPHLVAFDEMLL
jgi:hypothetical protein